MIHRTNRNIVAFSAVEPLEIRRMLAGFTVTFGQGEERDWGQAIAVDAAGNTYVAGIFHGRVDANPGRGRKILTSVDGSDDIFLAKYGPTGRFIWAQRFGSDADETVAALEVSAAGDVYLTGTIYTPVKFGNVQARTHGNNDVFIARFSPSGRTQWVRNIGGRRNDSVTAMAIGPDGDVYLSGGLRLEGYLSTTNTTPRVYIPRTRGADDTFIVRLDAATGALKWHTIFGEGDTRETVRGMAVDSSGGVFVAGIYYRDVQFDRASNAFNLRGEDHDQLYLGYLTSTGQWDRIAAVSSDDEMLVAGLAMGPSGDLFVTGNFEDSVDLDPTAGVRRLNSVGDSDAFIARYTPNFRLVWARQLANEDGDIVATGIAVDAAERVYTTGYFNETVDFDPGVRRFNIEADKSGDAPEIVRRADATDTYISRLTGAGAFSYAKRLGGRDGSVASYGIEVDAAGNAFVTGAFSGPVDFNPGAGVTRRKTREDDNDDTDVFVVKIPR